MGRLRTHQWTAFRKDDPPGRLDNQWTTRIRYPEVKKRIRQPKMDAVSVVFRQRLLSSLGELRPAVAMLVLLATAARARFISPDLGHLTLLIRLSHRIPRIHDNAASWDREMLS